MSYLEHAEREFAAIRSNDPDDELGNKMQSMMEENVKQLLSVFAEQGHSGGSAQICVSLFSKLALFEPISPINDRDEEWTEIADGVFQHKRCSHVFKDHGKAYDIEGKIFREKMGCCFTNIDSRTPVSFPYVPKREYVEV